MTDNVNHPLHYLTGRVEAIDVIEAICQGKPGDEAFLVGSTVKYLYRYPEKGQLESLLKAQWYLNRLIETVRAK